MTAIITDVHYRMAVALIRELGENGQRVVACERADMPRPVGFFSKYTADCVTLPVEGYGEALYELCRRTAAQDGEKPSLLPVGAKTLALLAREREKFQTVCGLCIPSTEQLGLFNDKNRVAALGKKLGLAVPESYEMQPVEDDAAFAARVPLPCVVKPVCGEKFGLHAAARYAICPTPQELTHWYRHFLVVTGEIPVVQEFLPGEGRGCSVLADRGVVVCHICHRRIREYPVTGGPSSCCQVIEDDTMLQAAKALVAETGYTGPAMFEFKLDAGGQPRLLEINPRVWGTYPLTRVSGSGFTLLWNGLSRGAALPPVSPPKPVRMVFYPSDLAAMLGYLRRKQLKKCVAGLVDIINPAVKNGLAERCDSKPGGAYWKSLLGRGKSKG